MLRPRRGGDRPDREGFGAEPRTIMPWYLGVLGNAYRLAGRTEEAMAAFRAYHARSPGFGLADIVMIQEQAGQLDDARETAAQLVAARPAFTVKYWLGNAVPRRHRADGGRSGLAAGCGRAGRVSLARDTALGRRRRVPRPANGSARPRCGPAPIRGRKS